MKVFLLALLALLALAACIAFVLAVLILLSKLGIEQSVVSLVAVVTSGAVAIRSLDVQRRLERERVLTDRRAKLIQSYRDVYEKVLAGETPTEQEMTKFNADLTFYGDEDLIRAWLNLRQAGQGQADPARVLPANMAFVRVMRRHLGHGDTSLTDEELFSVVMSNPDELKQLLEKQEPSKSEGAS